MDIKRYFLSALLSIISTSSFSFTITPDNISSASGCDASQIDCTVNWNNQIDFGSYDAIQITRSSGNAWLFRYDLYSPSAETTTYGFDGIVQSYTGNIWLEAPEIVTDAGAPINIYTDQITPDPDAYSPDFRASSWSFALNTTDAANASGSFTSTGDNGNGVITTGDLVINDGIFTCVECSIDVQLNLIGFNYLSNTLNFNPEDTRSLLLKYNDYDSYDPRDTERLFYVSSVPVPGAIWLFLSGIITLIGFRKKA